MVGQVALHEFLGTGAIFSKMFPVDFRAGVGLGTGASFTGIVPHRFMGFGHRDVEMKNCSPRILRLRGLFGYKQQISTKCSPCLPKEFGTFS